MNKITNNKILKYSYIIVSLLLAVAFFTNVTVLFVDAWFTDEITNHEDVKVAQVDIRILKNDVEIGGKTEIDHKDNFIQSDDIYKFTPATDTLEYQMPDIGQTVDVGIKVQNLGWAGGLVKLTGFTIYNLEFNHKGDSNNMPIFESQILINNNSEVWVSQFVDPEFDSGDPENNVIAYNMFLNRVLNQNETADVVLSITNNSCDKVVFPRFFVQFTAEITVYDSNAYQTNGSNPPFGEIESIPPEWTAWK